MTDIMIAAAAAAQSQEGPSFFRMVLEWYAIGAIFLSPASFLYAMYLDKKKDVYGKIDKLVDRMLGKENDKREDGEAKRAKQRKGGGDGEETHAKADEERSAQSIPTINIKPGEEYRFYLNASEEARIGMTRRRWTNDNPFAGKIDGEGRFVALREGEATIGCEGEKGSVSLYKVAVTARTPTWAAREEYELMARRADRKEIREHYYLNGWVTGGDDAIITASRGDGKNVAWKFSPDGRAAAFLTTWEGTDEERKTKLANETSQRMKAVVTNAKTGESQWVHMTGKDAQTCDLVAVILTLTDGRLAFGASAYWRSDASENEVAMNRKLTYRLFDGLLPEDPAHNADINGNDEATEEAGRQDEGNDEENHADANASVGELPERNDEGDDGETGGEYEPEDDDY